MFKNIALAATLAATALVAAPQGAEACDQGHYVVQVQPVREWVPARTERYQVREWVPGREYYVTETVVVRPACWAIDSCGRRIYQPPVTRLVQVKRQEPGCYQVVWKTRTVPGCYQTVNRQVRVWVSDCHCHARPSHGRVIVRTPSPSASSAGREIRRSGRKVDKEIHRAGRRINKEFKRLFD